MRKSVWWGAMALFVIIAGPAHANPYVAALAAPDTAITAGPPDPTTQTLAFFTFSSPQAGASFECKLDTPAGPGSYAACTSPANRSTAVDGTYTFSVRAVEAGEVDPTPATRTFRVDRTAPDTTVDSGPSGAVNTGTQTFSFSGNEPDVTFQCRLDRPGNPGAFATCAAPQDYATAGDGQYTFSVRAIDAVGNTDASPASRAFTVDTVEPDTVVDSGPTGTVGPSPSLSFHANEAGSSFLCRLDGGAFAACGSPHALGPLADGAHSVIVRARDAAGNLDPTPELVTFTVDATAPDTGITSGRSGASTSTAATFAFDATEVGATFECRLDTPAGAGTFAACTSAQAYTALADGAYTFAVRATDTFGNVDASPAARAFLVDTTAPETAVDSGPSGPTGDPAPALTFSATEPGATFECRLDGPGDATGGYGPCTSPRTLGPLTDGTYTFSVRATDAVGQVDATPATRTFALTVPPTATPTPPPPGPTATPAPEAPAPVFARVDPPKRTTLATFVKRGVRVTGECAPAGRGTAALTVSRAVAKRLKLTGTTLASAAASCAADGRLAVTLKPGAKVKRALGRQRGRLTATLTVTVAGARATRTMTLR